MYTLVTKQLAPRQLRAAIVKDDSAVLTIEMAPYIFYQNMRTNYTDVNVPVYITMKYNANVCSADFVNSVELHDKFKEALVFLLKSEYWNCVIIGVPAKELYDLYISNRQMIDSMTDLVLLDNTKALELINKWDVKDTLRIDESRHYLSIIKKSKVDLYKTKWWTDEEKYPNEKIN